MSQGPFDASNSGASTTNYTDDTTFYFLGGAPFTGPPDWTQVVNGYTPGSMGPFTSDWIIKGPGMISGKILSITFIDTGNKSVVVILQSGGGAFISGGGNNFSPPLPCFLEGSKILCSVDGTDTYVPVEDMKIGTLVKTSRNGYKKVEVIGHAKFYNPGTKERTDKCLYKCSPNNYPELEEDLYITGCHSILVPSLTDKERELIKQYLGKIFVTDNKYRLIACADERTEAWEYEGTYTVWHFALENENSYTNYGVYANGLLVETCNIHFMKEKSNMTLV
jgi:hypothetical protein